MVVDQPGSVFEAVLVRLESVLEPVLDRARRWRWLVAAGIVALLSLTALGEFDAALERMHPVGGVSGGVTSIARPLAGGDDIDAVLASWRDWESQARQDRAARAELYADPTDAVTTARSRWLPFLALDTFVFAPALAFVVMGVSWRRHLRVAAASPAPGSPSAGVRDALRLAAVVGAPSYLAVDVIENVVTALVVDPPRSVLTGVLGWIALAKVVVFGGVVAAAVVSFGVRCAPAELRRGLVQTVLTARVPIVVAVVVALVLTQLPASVRDQLADVVRHWREAPAGFACAVGATILLGFVVAVGSRTLLALHSAGGVSASRSAGLWWAVAVAGGAILLLGLLLEPFRPLFVPVGVLVAATGAISAPVSAVAATRDGFTPVAPVVVVAAILPGVGLATAVVGTESGVGSWGWSFVAIAVSVAGIVVSWWLAGGASLRCAGWLAGRRRPFLLGGSVVAGAVVVAWPWPVDWIAAGRALDAYATGAGAIAVLAVFMVGVVLFLGGLDVVAGRVPSAALATSGVRRKPLFAIVAVVFVASSLLDDEPAFHEARLLERTAGPDAEPTPGDLIAVLDVWLRQCDGVEGLDRPATCDAPVRPMFLVASSGGGARAAYWHVVVENCLVHGQAPDGATDAGRELCAGGEPPVLASGVSGGSVGIAMGVASPGAPVDAREVFEGGFLDVVIGNLLHVDVPNGFTHLPFGRDRAAALEVAWERRLPGLAAGLFETQAGPHGTDPDGFPIALFNSATIEEGCRMNVSVLRLAGTSPTASCRTIAPGVGPLAATRDLVDHVDPAACDISLSTAALLSARFPFVSPSGALVGCGDAVDAPTTFLVDGGYVESSGASTLAELVPAITAHVAAHNAAHIASADATRAGPGRPCVQPVVLQIDNGYAAITRREVSRPRELLAPLIGFGAASGGRSDAARQQLAIAVERLGDVGCGAVAGSDGTELPTYLHVYPEAHPGVQAPLGWALSSSAQRDLESQLFTVHNRRQIAAATAWSTVGS